MVEQKVHPVHHIKRRIIAGYHKVKAKIKSKESENKDTEMSFPLIDIAMKHKILATLSYLSILVLIPLIFGRKIEYIRYHARQGVALLGLWIVFTFSFYIPFLPWAIAILIILETIVGLVHVFKHRQKRLPLIGKMALI